MRQILNLITSSNLLDLFVVSTTLAVICMLIIGIVSYKKTLFISTLLVVGLDVSAILFSEVHIAINITICVVLTLVVVFSIMELLYYSNISQKFNKQANTFLSNSLYDYYFSTNKKDRIVDASESFLELVSLDLAEAKKSKGFSTMLGEMKIETINGREISDEVALKFLYGYEKTIKSNEIYQFDLSVVIDKEVVFLKGMIQPIYYKNHFLGRNVYLNQDHSATFDDLRTTIKKLVSNLEMDQKQMYALVSLNKNVIMYFDYKTKTYVATEALNNYLEINQKEFSIEEFFNMIHPEDISKYQEQGSMINSMMPNRAKLRLYINKKYYEVTDDSIYLTKDSCLVSLISLTSDPETISVKKQQEIQNETMWSSLEEMNPSEVMVELLNEVKKDDKHE